MRRFRSLSTVSPQQFEMKKSADEYKRATTAKSGVLDTNSLYKYKLIEDKLSPIIAQAKSMNLELEPILESTEKLWRKK